MPDEEGLDRGRVRRNFARAATAYDEAAVLSREVCTRMLERLELVSLMPTRVLDLGAGTGQVGRALVRRYPDATVTALDLSLPMLRGAGRRSWREALRGALGRGVLWRVCADFERLPIRSGAIDMVVSNLALHWGSASGAFAEAHRVLRRGGLLMFTTLGPDTLKELAQATAAGRPSVHAFLDMHDLGDMLVRSGFADPVMDMEHLTLTYAQLEDLLRDLRNTGALSARSGNQGLRTPRWRAGLGRAYERLRRDGRLPATFEIVYGHAWKPEHGPRVTEDGRAVIKLDRPRRG
jgi:malonyl-CoA O-methyltransferase